MSPAFSKLLARWAMLALGVTLATKLVDGIRCDDLETLLTVVVVLSVFNAVLKPVLLLFTLPFILLTLGLGVWVINALLFLWVGKLVTGFHVAGFEPAMWGALIVSLTNMAGSSLFKGPPRQPRPPRTPPGPAARRGGDVIDI